MKELIGQISALGDSFLNDSESYLSRPLPAKSNRYDTYPSPDYGIAP